MCLNSKDTVGYQKQELICLIN
uniref:Uncharacterized protein n=1 Tax=Anguilla anguilla TaxID=7936 RepID=A0A0E9P9E7_ANGAN